MATTKHVESEIDNNGKNRQVEVFVFHNPAKRKKEREAEAAASLSKKSKNAKPKVQPMPTRNAVTGKAESMSLEAVRNDVRNLGITGFAGRTKIEARLAQLKSLGAEIPKNWQRKMDKKKRNLEFEKRKQDLKAGMKTKRVADPNKKRADKSDKKKDDGVFIDGQVGVYKRGVQFISAADIKKIRSSVAKKL